MIFHTGDRKIRIRYYLPALFNQGDSSLSRFTKFSQKRLGIATTILQSAASHWD